MKNYANGTEGGLHLSGAPLTTEAIADVQPEMLLSSVDQRITKIRPMSTPVDQLSRIAGSRKADSMDVVYYQVDTKQASTLTTSAHGLRSAEDYGSDMGQLTVSVEDSSIFDKTDTVVFPLTKPDGATALTGYVADTAPGSITVVFKKATSGDIAAGQPVVRMGRAATELDVQTPQYQAIPSRRENCCQIFKMQFEQSSLMRIADKEIGWTFTEQEEAAVFEMRLGMERSFIFGSGLKFYDTAKNEMVRISNGIWNQAGRDISLDLNNLDIKALIDLSRKVFTGNNGSAKRLLIGGSAFVGAISAMATDNRIILGGMHEKWGLETREIITNFGKFYLIYSEVFDQCGHEKDALVLDQAFLTKYVHVPFHPEKLDLRAAGTRNTDAVVLTEASCLVLRNPNAHVRINGQ